MADVYLNDVNINIKYNPEKGRFEWRVGEYEGKPRVVMNFSVKQYLLMIKDFSSHILRLVDDGTITLPVFSPHTVEEDNKEK